MDSNYLYNMGGALLNGPVLLATAALFLAAAVCIVVLIRRQRAKTLKPEIKWTLVLAIAMAGGTALVVMVSSLPDLISPQVVERGRVLRVYTKLVDPENDVTLTYVSLSSGFDLVVPDVLGGRLVPGTCVELTHTSATNYVTVARQLMPDQCLDGVNAVTKTPIPSS